MSQVTQVYGGDEINAIVLDSGSAWTRVGWSAEDGPSISMSTNYAKLDGQARYGDHHTSLVRKNAEIVNPLKESVVEDWEGATGLWKAALAEASSARDTEYLTEVPLLITEPFWNSKQAQIKTMEFALEDLKTPAMYLAKSAVLSLFAAGRGSGIVVDVGAQTLSVTPVFDGFVLYKPAQRSVRSGDFLNKEVSTFLGSDVVPSYEIKSKTAVGTDEIPIFTKKSLPEGITKSFHSFQVDRVLQEFKESMLQVSETPYDGQASHSYKNRTFEFPDGHSVQLSDKRFEIAESIFRSSPSDSGSDSAMEVDNVDNKDGKETKDKEPETKEPKESKNENEDDESEIKFNEWSNKGVSEMIADCLNGCDVDARANLANNIVITGGTTLIQGFTERINQDLQKKFPMLKFRIFASGNMVERRNGAWIGGSILASLGTFHQLWVTKQEYDEVGADQIAYKRFK